VLKREGCRSRSKKPDGTFGLRRTCLRAKKVIAAASTWLRLARFFALAEGLLSQGEEDRDFFLCERAFFCFLDKASQVPGQAARAFRITSVHHTGRSDEVSESLEENVVETPTAGRSPIDGFGPTGVLGLRVGRWHALRRKEEVSRPEAVEDVRREDFARRGGGLAFETLCRWASGC